MTPGNVVVATANGAMSDAAKGAGATVETLNVVTAEAVAKAAGGIGAGDVLVVGPVPAKSTASNGVLVADTAKLLGVDVGGAKSGGVLSVLVDGPSKEIRLQEDGYPLSTILWYSG